MKAKVQPRCEVVSNMMCMVFGTKKAKRLGDIGKDGKVEVQAEQLWDIGGDRKVEAQGVVWAAARDKVAEVQKAESWATPARAGSLRCRDKCGQQSRT